MQRDDVIALVQVIQAYDNRDVSELTLATWSKAAEVAHWRRTEAITAVHEHYATSTAWLMPGHVTERIRAARRQPAPASDLALDRPPVASPERRAELMAQIRALAETKVIR